MCTAISFRTNEHYFGRNLDLEYHYNECVTITPRNFRFDFGASGCNTAHAALIGMATVVDNYPLYYEATNEFGLSIAALNFPGNAVYRQPINGKNCIPSYAFIPWVLCKCRTADETSALIKETIITDEPFSRDYPASPLHWLVSDRNISYTIEPLDDGLVCLENPVGVLTNNPTFPYHLHNLCNYMNLTKNEPVNRFSQSLDLKPYSRGMGAFGLPGDLSSASRFVRAAFTKWNSVCDGSEENSLSQFFHILSSVEQQRGCAVVKDAYEITLYQSCCNTDRMIYYYRTYGNSQITGVDLFSENIDSRDLLTFPLRTNQVIFWENK